MVRTILLSSVVVVLLLSCAGVPIAFGQELDVVNRPVNSEGLTGLLITTSPFTLPGGQFEFGAAALSEQSSVPDYSLNRMPSLSLSYGRPGSTEIAIRTSYVHFTTRTTDAATEERGAGDAQFSWKWNFLQQEESSAVPALAVFLTGIVPLSSKNENNVGGVTHWGAKAGLSLGREIDWGEQVIALFADGQAVVRDLNDDVKRDVYGIANLGLLLPISKNRNLQVIAEYGIMGGVDRSEIDIYNHSSMTFGLRLVTERLNLTIGTQFIRKRVEGSENANRVIGAISVKL